MTVEWNEQLMAAVRQAAFRGIVTSVELVIEEGNRMIREPPKTGRVYRRRGRTHQASAPGEAPATDTGRLIQSARPEYDEAGLSGLANWSTSYSARLEFGFSGVDAAGRNIDQGPRPYARPALANKKDEIVETINKEVRDALS